VCYFIELYNSVLLNNLIFINDFINDFWIRGSYHTEELIVENTTDALGVRIAIRDFLVNYVLANENSYHHAGNNHRTGQCVEHYGHRSVFTQLAR